MVIEAVPNVSKHGDSKVYFQNHLSEKTFVQSPMYYKIPGNLGQILLFFVNL